MRSYVCQYWGSLKLSIFHLRDIKEAVLILYNSRRYFSWINIKLVIPRFLNLIRESDLQLDINSDSTSIISSKTESWKYNGWLVEGGRCDEHFVSCRWYSEYEMKNERGCLQTAKGFHWKPWVKLAMEWVVWLLFSNVITFCSQSSDLWEILNAWIDFPRIDLNYLPALPSIYVSLCFLIPACCCFSLSVSSVKSSEKSCHWSTQPFTSRSSSPYLKKWLFWSNFKTTLSIRNFAFWVGVIKASRGK